MLEISIVAVEARVELGSAHQPREAHRETIFSTHRGMEDDEPVGLRTPFPSLM
jgi:hypothetical protein